MPWDPLVELGIRLLGPPPDLPEKELERAPGLATRAEQALAEKKASLRGLAPKDPRAARQLRALLADEIAQIEAYIDWARGFDSTDPYSALVMIQQSLQERIDERRNELRWCDSQVEQAVPPSSLR